MMKRKKTLCEDEFVIKPYLKIAANLLHDGKHFVDKVQQGSPTWCPRAPGRLQGPSRSPAGTGVARGATGAMAPRNV